MTEAEWIKKLEAAASRYAQGFMISTPVDDSDRAFNAIILENMKAHWSACSEWCRKEMEPEIERLRAALEQIASGGGYSPSGRYAPWLRNHMMNHAEEALKEDK